jgi:hypothetical protein
VTNPTAGVPKTEHRAQNTRNYDSARNNRPPRLPSGMSSISGARLIAGAFLLVASAALRAERLQIVAGVPNDLQGCASLPLPAVQVLSPESVQALGPDADPRRMTNGCVVWLGHRDLSDDGIKQVTDLLPRLTGARAVEFHFSMSDLSRPDWKLRVPYALKLWSSAVHASGHNSRVVIQVDKDSNFATNELAGLLASDELAPYIDAVELDADADGETLQDSFPAVWARAGLRPERGPAATFIAAVRRFPGARVVTVLSTTARYLAAGDLTLARLQAYFTNSVSYDPTNTSVLRSDGSAVPAVRFFDAKSFTPILILPEDSATRAEIDLSDGSYSKASVENLASGVKRSFDLKGGKALALDLSKGPLAVVLQPAARAGGETKAAVEVGAERGLTADEIVARERTWDAGQREKVSSFIADLKTSLRFRIAEVNETFDLTILGPLFYRRGEPSDWEWDEFFLNGVKWKGKTLPKLPILQPEKVTTLPLDIRLTEDYEYTLHGEATISGRRAYHIAFVPRSAAGDRPVYRGSVWIDKETFALLRRDSVQLNLKGETLSNVQTEFYRPVPGEPEVLLPLEIKGQQVFSTAGRTTAIERDVVMQTVVLNPKDFAERLAAAHASPAQMIRDTERGMRYLLPDPARPGQRFIEEKISKKSTFGLLGAFYDDSLDYPLPLLGIQHFNFDLWEKGKQLSVFFGGALLTANYTDPSLAGSRFDLGADLFAVAFAFGDVSYRNGKEVPSEKIKHLPAVFQVNVGHPLGPYLKASLGVFTKWDNFQRDKDTGPDFVTPVDTFTDGAELRLITNVSGFNAVASGSIYRRRKWEFWGDPTTSEFEPDQQHYRKYSLTISKDRYFSGFRKLHLGVAYLGGHDLDRFSKYEFGSFSGNPVRGYKSGSLRTESAFVANVSYGLNIEDIIRFEGFYDQALVKDKRSGFDNAYFSGAGLLASVNGPWQNSLLRAEIGTPVVSHGIRGFVVNVLLLKLF